MGSSELLPVLLDDLQRRYCHYLVLFQSPQVLL